MAPKSTPAFPPDEKPAHKGRRRFLKTSAGLIGGARAGLDERDLGTIAPGREVHPW